jgi:tetratricopeptide (TPR) repeat protein
VKKQQYLLLSGSLILFIGLFFFGNTIPPKKTPAQPASTPHAAAGDVMPTITTADVMAQAKAKLSPAQASRITQLENSVVRGDVKYQQIKVYDQLASFWDDTLHQHILGAYYTGEAAKLENSEKKLTFAARLLLDGLMEEQDPARQNWLATNAKSLFEKSLELNPANDSAKIGIGACYLFGNIAPNPMQGIMIIREVVEKNPDNMYGQMMLGIGGIRSGQYDRAIERFTTVVNKQPDNMEAILYLAEAYERKGDKANAVKWYKLAAQKIAVPEAKQAIEERIKTLQ